MPELPWVKWYPQNWGSEPGLAKCEPATRGIWIDAVNAMMLEHTDRISGTTDELSRVCRCRPAQMTLAISQLKTFGVAEVQMQNGCTSILCRRIAREVATSGLRRKAAFIRWGKTDASIDAKALQPPDANVHAPSTSTSSSTSESSEGGSAEGGRKGKPDTEVEVVAYCESVGLPASDGRATWAKWEGNGFTVNKQPMKDWRAVVRSWKLNGYLPSQRAQTTQPHIAGSATKPLSQWEITEQLKAIPARLKEAKAKADWPLVDRLTAREKELKQLATGLR